MKSARIFNYSWFLFTVVAAVVVGEFITWEVSLAFGFRSDPLLVAFLCISLSTAIAAVCTRDAELK